MTLAFIAPAQPFPFSEKGMDEGCIRLKALLLDKIMGLAGEGYDTFYCGGCSGWDALFGRQVLLVKLTAYPQIRLICVAPGGGRAACVKLLSQADGVVYISGESARARYMVDRAGAVLALAGSPNGALDYARQWGKKVLFAGSD